MAQTYGSESVKDTESTCSPALAGGPHATYPTQPVANRTRPSALILIILSLSLMLRLAIALYLGDAIDAPPLLSDQRSYDALGQRLIQGHGFSFAANWYPFTRAETPTAHWSFLYSLFVAAIYALFGPSVLAVRITQALLVGLLMPLATYRLTLRVFPGRLRLGIWALALTAVYAYLLLYAATLMTESLYILLLLWSLSLGLEFERTLRQGHRVSPGLALGLGLSLGLAALMRQAILPWAPVLFLYLLFCGYQARKDGATPSDQTRPRWRETCVSLAVAGLALIACIVPFTVRNYRVYGTFLLLNSNTGYAMYSAQHPMHGNRFQEFAAAPLPEDLASLELNEAQLDRALLRRGLESIADEPLRYLRLCLSRVRAFFSPLPSADTTPLHAIGRLLAFGAYAPLWWYGLYLSLRRPPTRANLGMPLLFMAFYTAMHVLTWAMVRYRLPVDAVSMPFAALAMDDLWSRLSAKGSASALMRRIGLSRM